MTLRGYAARMLIQALLLLLQAQPEARVPA